jgi:hypothetical protein
VIVPGPGTLSLSGKGIAGGRRTHGAAPSKKVGAAGAVRLLIRAAGRARRRLARTGAVKLKAKVTYAPVGGSASSKARPVRLIRRRPRRRSGGI